MHIESVSSLYPGKKNTHLNLMLQASFPTPSFGGHASKWSKFSFCIWDQLGLVQVECPEPGLGSSWIPIAESIFLKFFYNLLLCLGLAKGGSVIQAGRREPRHVPSWKQVGTVSPCGTSSDPLLLLPSIIQGALSFYVQSHPWLRARFSFSESSLVSHRPAGSSLSRLLHVGVWY